MQCKSKVGTLIKQFFTYAKTQLRVAIKAIHTDNAKELALHDFLTSKGVYHQFSYLIRP